jgi:hypothetical protein
MRLLLQRLTLSRRLTSNCRRKLAFQVTATSIACVLYSHHRSVSCQGVAHISNSQAVASDGSAAVDRLINLEEERREVSHNDDVSLLSLHNEDASSSWLSFFWRRYLSISSLVFRSLQLVYIYSPSVLLLPLLPLSYLLNNHAYLDYWWLTFRNCISVSGPCMSFFVKFLFPLTFSRFFFLFRSLLIKAM